MSTKPILTNSQSNHPLTPTENVKETSQGKLEGKSVTNNSYESTFDTDAIIQGMAKDSFYSDDEQPIERQNYNYSYPVETSNSQSINEKGFIGNKQIHSEQKKETPISTSNFIEVRKVESIESDSESPVIFMPLNEKPFLDISDIILKPFSIAIKTSMEKTINVEVDQYDTIKECKRKIQDKEGFPIDQQILWFVGEQLEDDWTFANYGIYSASELELNLHLVDGSPIFIKKLNDNSYHSLIVNPSDTIESCKTKIQEQAGIPVDQQILWFNGRELSNEYTLSDYGIYASSKLNLFSKLTKEFKVVIKTRKEDTFSLVVDPLDQVKNCKMKIQESVGIPYHDQILIFAGRGLEDERTLAECGVYAEASLGVYQKLSPDSEIFIRTMTGKTISLQVNPSDTIGGCKTKIFQKEGMPEDQQRLVFNGVLEDHYRLSDFLYREAEIHLILKLRGGGGPAKQPKSPIILKKKGNTYYAQHDGHGSKHILPAEDKLSKEAKKKLIAGTKKGCAMFYPDIINAKNYDDFVTQCVRTWVNKGADVDNKYLEAEYPIGADKGEETNWVEIYLSDVGAHVRPKYLS